MGVFASASRGAVAGVLATAAMDLVWYRRHRAGGGEQGLLEWEFSSSATSFDEAPAPAQVGRLVADTLGVTIPDSEIATTNNLVHWMTGIGWGKFAAVAGSILPVPIVAVGVATGVSAWATSYAVLGRLGIYRPVAEYDRETLLKDLSAHLVFGASLGVALMVMTPSSARRAAGGA